MSDSFLNPRGLDELRTWILGKLGLKQDTLVSGTNIKTINNTSILGSGNIDISGSSYTAGYGIDITNNVISIDLPNAEGGEF